MARKITKAMAGILQELELENTTYVDIRHLEELVKANNIKSSPTVVASRLKDTGWLIPTSQRGVWEFSPASAAGTYSRCDPLVDIKAFATSHPNKKCYLCLQTAAWALGLADRVPTRKEVAFPDISKVRLPENVLTYRYSPKLDPVYAKDVFVLAPESILVHIASKPDIIRNWESAMEWIPEVIYETDIDKLLIELGSKNNATSKRMGYLLQGMYPEAAKSIKEKTVITSKSRFGPRTKSLRNNEEWMIADTLLPFNPKELEAVK